MARGSCLAGKIKAGILGLAVLGAMALPAHAGDPPKLALSGSAWLTTDYMFRSISNTSQNPAAQVEFDLTYGIFYGYVWGSNTDFGGEHRARLRSRHHAEMGPDHLQLRRPLLHLSGR